MAGNIPQSAQQAAIAAMNAKVGRANMAVHAHEMAAAAGVYEADPESARLMLYIVAGIIQGQMVTINKGDPVQFEAAKALRAATTDAATGNVHQMWRWVTMVNEPVDSPDLPAEGTISDEEHEAALADLDEDTVLEGEGTGV